MVVILSLVCLLLILRLHLIQAAFDVFYQDVKLVVTMLTAASGLSDMLGLCGLLLLIPAVNVTLQLVL